MAHNSERAVDTPAVAVKRALLAVAAHTLLGAALFLAPAGCSIAPPPPDNERALADIAAHRAGAEEVVTGTVLQVLPESGGPSGVHERFIVDVSARASHVPLYVADNISLGQAAPLRVGDHVIVKGELAFNEYGAVLHWTHRDPRLRHAPGFVEVSGHLYE